MDSLPKNLHIVFGKSAQGIFKESGVFNLDDIHLICLEDALNIGPVCDLYSKEDLERRTLWWSAIYDILPPPEFITESFDFIPEKDIEMIKSIIENRKKFNRIYIWTGISASEIIHTARLLYYLGDVDIDIFITDFSKVSVKRYDGQIIHPEVLYVVAAPQVGFVVEHFEKQTKNDVLKWQELWKRIVLQKESTLIVLDKKETIKFVGESYFDSVLEANCTNEFQTAVRIIGHTLLDINFEAGDGFLNWRLKHLCLTKKLEFDGQLDDMRKYKVKRAV